MSIFLFVLFGGLIFLLGVKSLVEGHLAIKEILLVYGHDGDMAIAAIKKQRTVGWIFILSGGLILIFIVFQVGG